MYNTVEQILNSDWWQEYNSDPAHKYYKINAQQLAKNPILLDCLVPTRGYKFVELDFSSLEPTVLAEFSGDPCYREIYASNKPHDVYFYITCKLLDADGKIAATYKLDNPTPESVKEAKKLFKKERSVGKVFQLMSTYKAGAPAIHRKLLLFGFPFPIQEVYEMRNKYWGLELFGQILEYEQGLLAEVDQRDGWIKNGTNRPIVVRNHKRKDVLNTVIQSSGHDYTDMLILFVEQLADKRGVEAIPVIPDYHDETIWMCPEDQANELAEIMTEAVKMVNDSIKFEIPLKGDPEITDDFTSFKGPDPVEWYTTKKGNTSAS